MQHAMQQQHPTSATVLALLVAIIAALCGPASGELDPRETAALVAAFHSLGGAKWRNGTGAGNWLRGDPCADRWYGIQCNANGSHVLSFFPSVEHSGNDLDGAAGAR